MLGLQGQMDTLMTLRASSLAERTLPGQCEHRPSTVHRDTRAIRVMIVDDHLMAVFHQAACNVAAHASETDHADLHVTAPHILTNFILTYFGIGTLARVRMRRAAL